MRKGKDHCTVGVQFNWIIFDRKENILFLKMGHSRPLFNYFLIFKQTLQFVLQIYVKNVHPVNGHGIQTHDLLNVILLP